jgi:pyridoxamine 5'-phosphate oxidase
VRLLTVSDIDMGDLGVVVSAMRRRYGLAGLSEQDLAPTWLEQFTLWFAAAAASPLVVEPNAMVLATAGADGMPSARNVLLKGFDADGLVFFTNLESAKAHDLAVNPRAALVFSWLPLERQVRFSGPVRQVSRDRVAEYFATRPHGAQVGAWASPQSSVIADRAELAAAVATYEQRWPEGTPVTPPPSWGGFLVDPEAVEFWQGRPNRLHDRLRYRRTDGHWTVERLAP